MIVVLQSTLLSIQEPTCTKRGRRSKYCSAKGVFEEFPPTRRRLGIKLALNFKKYFTIRFQINIILLYTEYTDPFYHHIQKPVANII